MDKNPFSLYDFLGYLVPGILCLFLTYKACTLPLDLSQWTLKTFFELPFTMDVPMVFILVICCYTLGHIVSYSSSITIEQYANKQYGYPTSYLLGDIENIGSMFVINFKFDRNYTVGEILNISVSRIVLLFILGPFVIVDWIFGHTLCLKNFFIKPLDNQLVIWVYEKINALKVYLNISESLSSLDEPYDIHRIIHHYIYESVGKQHTKFDNYVALYGFLRSIIICILAFYFIFCCRYNSFYVFVWLFIILMFLFLYTIMHLVKLFREELSNLSSRSDRIVSVLKLVELISVVFCLLVFIGVVVVNNLQSYNPIDICHSFFNALVNSFGFLSCFTMILAYVFFMAFMKFYRKYTVLAFMCLISDVNLRN